ncbi:MAG: response regulator [Lachnospiraceae bacterium]|nr:response regulator [Lachnospiraceae bacterium]
MMGIETAFRAEGIKALVVDDNEVNTMVVASMLEQFSISVTEVYSGKSAIEKERLEEFDIIFMDYLMPEMNGIEATEEIRKLGKAKRPIIVALTANETNELKGRFKQAGVDDVMVKPLELEAVCHILQKWFPDKTVESFSFSMEEQDSGKKALLEAFSKIEELDVEKGLSHLANSANNYIKVIKAAVDNIHSERNRLSMYQDSQVQVTSMKNCFHSLKGVFLNLGVSRLSNQSQLFELACGNQEEEYIRKSLEGYLQDLEDFTIQLEEALLEYDATYTKSRSERYIPMDEAEFAECVEELKYYLSRYEFNYLPELTEKLVYATKGEERDKMNQIAKQVQCFQYEEALKILQQME